MANEELKKFVESSRAKGMKDTDIKTQLLGVGWAEPEVSAALTPKTEVHEEVPLPPQKSFGMWVSFQYIILFITLYVSAISLGGMMRYAAARFIKDPLSTGGYYSGFYQQYVIMGYLSAIIVAFPIFVTLFIILSKQFKLHPEVKNFRSRKFLIYLTMIITFLVMIGHLISTIYRFLMGTATSLSLVNFAITLLIGGSIFFDLFMQVKQDRKTS